MFGCDYYDIKPDLVTVAKVNYLLSVVLLLLGILPQLQVSGYQELSFSFELA